MESHEQRQRKVSHQLQHKKDGTTVFFTSTVGDVPTKKNPSGVMGLPATQYTPEETSDCHYFCPMSSFERKHHTQRAFR